MTKRRKQYIPIAISILTFFLLIFFVYVFIVFLNRFPLQKKIYILFQPMDILVGIAIYLKTSLDFALVIGNQMKRAPGWRNRIAIETGTAFGNAVGTLLVLTIWTFFKEVPLLMALMILFASLVLLRMTQEGITEYLKFREKNIPLLPMAAMVLGVMNKPFSLITNPILPHHGNTSQQKRSFSALFLFSFSIPFLLGLDDFAGYIPLFSLVNVFGFAIGIFFGHMILNIGLFASPNATISLVKRPSVIMLGSFAFLAIGLWGFYEAASLFIHLFLA